MFGVSVGLALSVLLTASAAAPAGQATMVYMREAAPCRSDAQGGRMCKHGIFTSAVDGTRERQLTSGVAVANPTWSPSRDRIAYLAATGRKGIFELWLMKANGSGKRRLPIREPYLYDPERLVPAWTPDAKEILVPTLRATRREGTTILTPVVLAVPVDGGKPRELFAMPRSKYYAGVASPQLSPSGKLIAFLYLQSGARASLYVARPDGSGRRRLATASGDLGRNLDWSPDSKRIVFTRWAVHDGSFNPELFVINANGSGLRRLTTTDGTNNNLKPSWAPDGRQILFTSGLTADGSGVENHDNRFAVINADGSGFHFVGPGKENCITKGWFASKWCYATDPDWGSR